MNSSSLDHLESAKRILRNLNATFSVNRALEYIDAAISEEMKDKRAHANAEAMCIESAKHLNCPHCGGSGHVDDCE